MFEPKYFANPNTCNLILFAPFGKVVFRNHICTCRTEEAYKFLKSYKECFEIDKDRYLADETQLTNTELFRKNIHKYKVEDKVEEPKKEVKVEVATEEPTEEPKRGRKPKQA